jgi:hypothetical protein
MKARQLIDGGAFGPETLKAVGQAFDEAWAQIAANFGNDPHDVGRARLRLADAMLSVAKEDSRNVAELKKAALETMAQVPQSPATTPLDFKIETRPVESP